MVKNASFNALFYGYAHHVCQRDIKTMLGFYHFSRKKFF